MIERISPLRQRLIDDMTIRNMSPLIQKAYIRAPRTCGPIGFTSSRAG